MVPGRSKWSELAVALAVLAAFAAMFLLGVDWDRLIR